MRKLKLAILLVLLVVLCSLTLFGRRRIQQDYANAHVYEPVIRGYAINAPMPVYPEEAVRAGAQGLVDIAVRFDAGKLTAIKVLDSPHPAITRAVRDAVKQWTFRALYDSPDRETARPVRVLGELRFHFIIRDGVGIVENPSREEQEIRSEAYQKVMREELARLHGADKKN
jgi:TonB family protein